MNRIIEPEKSELRMMILKRMEDFIDKLPENNNLGYISDNIVELMTDAAFAVLLAIHDINIYIDEQGLMK